MWRGGVGWAYLLADPFGCRCLNSHTMLRFHIPLFKPDVRLARIRLSDKDSRFRPRQAASKQRQFHQPQRLVELDTHRRCINKSIFVFYAFFCDKLIS